MIVLFVCWMTTLRVVCSQLGLPENSRSNAWLHGSCLIYWFWLDHLSDCLFNTWQCMVYALYGRLGFGRCPMYVRPGFGPWNCKERPWQESCQLYDRPGYGPWQSSWIGPVMRVRVRLVMYDICIWIGDLVVRHKVEDFMWMHCMYVGICGILGNSLYNCG